MFSENSQCLAVYQDVNTTKLQYLEHSGISCTPFIPEALEMSRVFSKGTVLWSEAAGRPK